MRRLLLVLFVTFVFLGASPAKKSSPPPPSPAAPDVMPHQIALFLRELTRDGTRPVTLRATAVSTRFFLEEPAGVTVYRFDKGRYVKEEFMRGAKLAAATKKYRPAK